MLAGITNKFMLAEWQNAGHLDHVSRRVDLAEVDLLKKVAEKVAGDQGEYVRGIADSLNPGDVYPQVSDDDTEKLTDAFAVYCVNNEYYEVVVGQLTQFIESVPDSHVLAQSFMRHIWGHLAGATIPDREMLGIDNVRL